MKRCMFIQKERRKRRALWLGLRFMFKAEVELQILVTMTSPKMTQGTSQEEHPNQGRKSNAILVARWNIREGNAENFK